MQNKQGSHRYDDIINLPHPEPRNHRRMSMIDRAAQFSPFAALSGYDAAVKETARLTNERMELDEDSKARLNEQIQYVLEHLSEEPEIVITYFLPDQKKAGGSYVDATGIIKKIDDYEQLIIFRDGTKIPVNDVVAINSEVLNHLDSV